MTRRQIPLVLASLLVPMAALSGPTASTAAEPPEQHPIEESNPGISPELLASLPAEVLESDVVVDSSYEPGTPIVYPDGRPVAGQSSRATAYAASFCGGTVYGLGTGGWGPTSVGTCGVFGYPGYMKGYYWQRTSSLAGGCVQGRGFNSAGTRTWYALSCGTQNLGQYVPWGNILATPATRAQSLGVPAGFTAQWGP